MCTIKLNGSRPVFAPGGSIAYDFTTETFVYSPRILWEALLDDHIIRYVAVWPSCARKVQEGVMPHGTATRRSRDDKAVY